MFAARVNQIAARFPLAKLCDCDAIIWCLMLPLRCYIFCCALLGGTKKYNPCVSSKLKMGGQKVSQRVNKSFLCNSDFWSKEFCIEVWRAAKVKQAHFLSELSVAELQNLLDNIIRSHVERNLQIYTQEDQIHTEDFEFLRSLFLLQESCSKPMSEPSGQSCLLPPPQQARRRHIRPANKLSWSMNVFQPLWCPFLFQKITIDLGKLYSRLVSQMPLAHPIHLLLQAHVQHHYLQLRSHPAPEILGIETSCQSVQLHFICTNTWPAFAVFCNQERRLLPNLLRLTT